MSYDTERFTINHQRAHSELWRGGFVRAPDSCDSVGDSKPTPKRTRKRKPTLTGVAQQVAKAGIEVAGYEVRPDGSIKVIIGKSVGASDVDDTASPDPKWN